MPWRISTVGTFDETPVLASGSPVRHLQLPDAISELQAAGSTGEVQAILKKRTVPTLEEDLSEAELWFIKLQCRFLVPLGQGHFEFRRWRLFQFRDSNVQAFLVDVGNPRLRWYSVFTPDIEALRTDFGTAMRTLNEILFTTESILSQSQIEDLMTQARNLVIDHEKA